MRRKDKLTYCLDTNIVSELLRGNVTVTNRLRYAINSGMTCGLPAVVYYEIMRGLLSNISVNKMNIFSKFRNELWQELPMTDSTFLRAAQIYAILRKQGNLIEDNDIFIGAIAIEYDCILVTDNIKHLGRIKGLHLENWKES